MARLPDKYALSAPGSLRSGRVIAREDTSAIGRGLQAAGADISSLGAQVRQSENAVDIARAEAYKTQQFLQAENGFMEDGDYATFGKRAPQASKEIIDTAANLIRNPSMRARWMASAQGDAARFNDGIVDRGRALRKQAETVAFDDALEANRRIYVDPDTDEKTKTKARADIDGAIQAGLASGLLTPDEAEKRRQVFLEAADFSRGELAVQRDPAIIRKPLPKDVGTRAGIAMQFFQARGYTKEQAAGIVGNLIAESNLQPSGAVGDSGTAFGVAQWRGERLNELKRFAAAHGKDWQDFETQLAFVDSELQNSETAAYNALKSAHTVADATAAFIGYERPAGWSADNPRGGHNFSGRLDYAARVAGQEVNPDWYQRLSPEQQAYLQDKASARQQRLTQASDAQAKADYTAHKNAFELGILTGDVVSESQILSDAVLDNGDKATLLRSFRSQQGENADISAYIAAWSQQSEAAKINPYNSADASLNDKAYDQVIEAVPEDQRPLVSDNWVASTGYVPKTIVAGVRQDINSTDPATVANGMQQASKYLQIAPEALDAVPNGQELKDAATAFNEYVYGRGMSADQAGARWIETHSPEAIEKRQRLKDPAKDFLKTLALSDVTNSFDTLFSFEPSAGLTVDQQMAVMTDYSRIAEEKFLDTGGDAKLAKKLALQEMGKLYGVSEVSGENTLMKFPPERYYPAINGGWDYIRDEAMQDAKSVDDTASNVMLIPTKETADDIRTHQPPRYRLFFQRQNGVWDEAAGGLFRVSQEKLSAGLDTDRQEHMDEANRLHQIAVHERATEARAIAAGRKAADQTIGPAWMKARAAEAATENTRTEGEIQLPKITVTPESP